MSQLISLEGKHKKLCYVYSNEYNIILDPWNENEENKVRNNDSLYILSEQKNGYDCYGLIVKKLPHYPFKYKIDVEGEFITISGGREESTGDKWIIIKDKTLYSEISGDIQKIHYE
jgi:hypothetical protein